MFHKAVVKWLILKGDLASSAYESLYKQPFAINLRFNGLFCTSASKLITRTMFQYKERFYASAFRRRRHYVFGLSVRPSVRPSVRSLKYLLLTCTWVRWSTRPTITVLRHVRPSVCLSVRPSGEVSGHLPENVWREWPEIMHADVSWSPSELISSGSRSVDLCNFCTILT